MVRFPQNALDWVHWVHVHPQAPHTGIKHNRIIQPELTELAIYLAHLETL